MHASLPAGEQRLAELHRLDHSRWIHRSGRSCCDQTGGGRVSVGELPLDYHLRPPYAATYEENYRLHCDV